MLENPKGSPLSVFRHCETFFRKFVFSPKGPPFTCDKNVINFGSVPLLARQELALAGPGAPLGPFFFAFSIFEYCKLTLGSPFAIFEPRIWRRLGPVPACFKLSLLWGSTQVFNRYLFDLFRVAYSRLFLCYDEIKARRLLLDSMSSVDETNQFAGGSPGNRKQVSVGDADKFASSDRDRSFAAYGLQQKFSCQDFNFVKVLGKGSFGKVSCMLRHHHIRLECYEIVTRAANCE